ncbi:MAG: PHP-associated domain-containing protein [archaeon]
MNKLMNILTTAVFVTYVGFNAFAPIKRHYVMDLVKEVPKVMSGWFSDQSYKEQEGKLLADLHVHFSLPKSGIEKLVDDLMKKVDIVGITGRGLPYHASALIDFDDFKKHVQDLGPEYDVFTDNKLVKIKTHDDVLYVIRSQEIMTKKNIEVVAVGCEESFNSYIDIDSLLAEISDQGGFSFIAHPYSLHKSLQDGLFGLPNNEDEEEIIHYAKKCTAIETFNAQNTWFGKSMVGSNILAKRTAKKYGLPGLANSDSHYVISETGLAGTVFYEELLDFSSGDNLIKSLKQSIENENFELHTEYNNPLSFGKSIAGFTLRNVFYRPI